MLLTIRLIDDAETDHAFALLRAVARWLDHKGRRQRIATITIDTYRSWQAARGNWGVYDGDDLAAIFTVIREPLDDWPDVEIERPEVPGVFWLRALAVDPERRGRAIGAEAVDAALALVDPAEHLYLDCVSDFLPGYYTGRGFELMARQVRRYPDGVYDISLLRQPGRRTDVNAPPASPGSSAASRASSRRSRSPD